MNYTYLFVALVSATIFFVPFIQFLYKIKLQDKSSKKVDAFGKSTPIFAELKKNKDGTPTGGGILIIGLSAIGLLLLPQSPTTLSLFMTMILFGGIGLIDDIKRIGIFPNKLLGLSFGSKLLIQLIFSLIVGWLVATNLDYLSILPQIQIESKILITFIIAITVVFMSNAFNITDGVDGLAIGLFIIILLGVSAIPFISSDINSSVSIFIGISLAYLYFNIEPARIFMGDTGALGLGAITALIFILIDRLYLIPIFCLPYIIEAFSSLLQLGSKKFLNRKLFEVAPLHHLLERRGWSESKVSIRMWLFGIVSVLLGLLIIQIT